MAPTVGGPPVAPQVGRDHAEALGQRADVRVEEPRVDRAAVQAQSQHPCHEGQSRPELAIGVSVYGEDLLLRAKLLELRNQGVFAGMAHQEAVDVLTPVVLPPGTERSRAAAF